MDGPTLPQPPGPLVPSGSSSKQHPVDTPPDDAPAEPPAPPEIDESIPEALPLPEWLSFLRNRLILGGLGVVVVMLLVAIVLVALGGGDDGANPTLAVGAGTPEGTPADWRSEGLPGRMRATVSLRNGPSSGYPILGIVPRGARVSVVGRDEDTEWLQVVPASGITGWVPEAAVDVTGNVSTLPIGAAGAGPSIAVPTQVPGVVPQEPVVPPTAPPPPPPTRPPTAPPRPPTATPRPAPTATPVPPPPTATPSGGAVEGAAWPVSGA